MGPTIGEVVKIARGFEEHQRFVSFRLGETVELWADEEMRIIGPVDEDVVMWCGQPEFFLVPWEVALS